MIPQSSMAVENFFVYSTLLQKRNSLGPPSSQFAVLVLVAAWFRFAYVDVPCVQIIPPAPGVDILISF